MMQRVACCLVLAVMAAGCNRSKEIASGSGRVIASAGGVPVVMNDLEREFPDFFLRMRQQEYRNEMSLLESYLLKQAVTGDAKRAGQTLDEYLQARMKVRPVTDDDVARLVQRFESEEDLRRVLASHRRDEARSEVIQELLAAKGVRILLEPPRFPIPVTIDDPVRGRSDAPITIVEFSDFTCGFCALATPTVERVLDKYKGEVRLVYKHAPRNGEGIRLAQFAACAKDTGRFWEAHDYLFTATPESVEDAIAHAVERLRLPAAKVTQCIGSGGTWNRIERDRKLAESLGVRGTPTFFVNGLLVPHTNFFSDFTVIVDRERQRLSL